MKLEDQNEECKQSWRDEHLKWVCGFANAAGGRVAIGVADDKDGNLGVGVPSWKTLLESTTNLMRDTLGMVADVNHNRMDVQGIVEVVAPACPVPRRARRQLAL